MPHDAPVACPHPLCYAQLQHKQHLQRHMQDCHSTGFQRRLTHASTDHRPFAQAFHLIRDTIALRSFMVKGQPPSMLAANTLKQGE
ncbi:hypothetical protein BAUCODRAFT_440419 [Baudoinia panamericana UAMH 10762]|uniref:C2H2-type domain-containing protein n=1 Tax=Baudoinia panamericana (strain UAMH 10762) TaxID=717646 RepID=M2LRQ3_BAUPA|nr:uncharacterized protein BAUCODRAFT_440419 [Baudoinia panamericana UAMH 10762]EMC97142.1 hypothetical protein BAUCODRAFT_440419 [Baudoinia panamericana UAMH 10762]